MAGNDLTNASFLDGTSGWSAISGGLAVDESLRGGMGRAVLVSGAGAISTGVAVTAGQVIEAAALFGDTSGAAQAKVVINAGGSAQELVLPICRRAVGVCRAGAPETLNFAYDLITAPFSGVAALVVAGSGEVWLSKPYLDAGYVQRQAYVWDPGTHLNADLNALPVWPASLPPILLEGYGCTPTPIRKGWSGDAGRENTTRMAGMSAWDMQARLSVTTAQLADLEAFHRTTDSFLFVRPDTAQLCKAKFMADGDPVSQAKGVAFSHYVTFALQLEVL